MKGLDVDGIAAYIVGKHILHAHLGEAKDCENCLRRGMKILDERIARGVGR